ncbi:HIT-like protein [Fomitopsis serialis]|uniref:HIT-like protein n=1 Tax=Fomitopsis serialis TaxID=139415 RepID=UPI00200872AF|nr:HIT-like protein [Neoantrodia serialis]KAH9936242.1 HIT-like protein [Neoantrodia serialis]
MTSFIIKAHTDRPVAEAWKADPDCPFCRIIRGDAQAFLLYENDLVTSFLDILPLRPGHALVVPKTHYARVSELPPESAAAVGMAVSTVARAMTEALQNTALNVVCNQEYAQAVPHVHYHIIPAPRPGSSEPTSDTAKVDHVVKPLTQKEMHKMETESRDELDDEEAKVLAEKIRARL